MIHLIGPQALLCCQNHSTIQDLLDWLKDKEIVAVDTETEGFFDFSNKVIMLQIGNEQDQFVIDTRTTDVSLLAPFFANPNIIKVFWNAKFDIKFLRFTFNFDVDNVYDGFLAECVLNTGREDVGLSLDAASGKYLNKKLNKQVRNKFVGLSGSPFTDMQVTYGAEDVEVLLPIRNQQLELIAKERLGNVVKLENSTVLAIADIEYNGMLMQVDAWKDVAALTTTNVEEQVRVLDELVIANPKLSRFVPQGTQGNLFGFEERRLHINWSSPKQKATLLSALLNIPVDSSSTPFLLKYRQMPLIAAMLEYSKQKKLSDSFGYDFLKYVNPVTLRVHQDIWQVLDTGRMSSSDPNMTQIPSKGELAKKIRAAFIAEPGHKFVGGDFSACELRIIAAGSLDPVWLEAFNNGEDLHGKLAQLTFGITKEEILKPTPFKADMTYRDVQKTINFGLAYGMSEYKLSATIDVSVETAKSIIDAFFKAVPKVKRYLDSLGTVGLYKLQARTMAPFFRARYFESPEGSENPFKAAGSIERQAKNTPIQGTNADITKLALIFIRRHIRSNNLPIRIVNVIHDEIITEVPDHLANEWKPVMEQLMLDAAKTVLKDVPMKADVKISHCWTK